MSGNAHILNKKTEHPHTEVTPEFGEGNSGALLSLGLLSIVTQNQRIPFRSLCLLF